MPFLYLSTILTEFGVSVPAVTQLTDLYSSQIDTLTKHMLETGKNIVINLTLLTSPAKHSISQQYQSSI